MGMVSVNQWIKRSVLLFESLGADEITFGATKNCFEEFNDILKFIFDLSFQTGVFPDSFKTAKVTPLSKNGKPTEIINYRPISVLACFWKILKLIMVFTNI